MSTQVDKQAVIAANVDLAENVTIGPYSVIGPDVKIGSGTVIGSHVVIYGDTTIGRDNKISPFALLGGDPQDLKYQGGKTALKIGDRNIFREGCTVNRGTELGGGVTIIGNDNLFMTYTHVAHDCILKDHIVLSNHASLAGHVTVENYAVLGGFAGVHQFCHIGKHSFATGGSLIIKDVLPFMRVSGHYAKPFGLNTVGLQRHNFSEETINLLKQAYRIIYRNNLTLLESIEALQKLPKIAEIDLLIEALQYADRGITR